MQRSKEHGYASRHTSTENTSRIGLHQPIDWLALALKHLDA
jgi:hypothetical protein